MKDGERNSGYFHKLTKARKIHKIQANDREINNFDEIKSEATRYFSDLFADQPTTNDVQLLNLFPGTVKSKENDNLNKPITLEEIKEAVDNMEEDRAPGPDGFNANFITSCWDIIKKDLLKMICKSQKCGKIGGSMNSAHLALIPKRKKSNLLTGFRQYPCVT